MKKKKFILSWILRILVSLGFLAASLGKISNNQEVVKMFENWGFPEGFHFIIGTLELLFAILLLIPKTMKVAIIGITLIMIGASVTHLLNDPVTQTIRPIVFLILILSIYYIHYPIKKAQ